MVIRKLVNVSRATNQDLSSTLAKNHAKPAKGDTSHVIKMNIFASYFKSQARVFFRLSMVKRALMQLSWITISYSLIIWEKSSIGNENIIISIIISK